MLLSAADYIDSNISMRSLVLPMRICFRVLYLSRPWATFCWCRMSLRVAFVSSFAAARSALRDCNGHTVCHYRQQWCNVLSSTVVMFSRTRKKLPTSTHKNNRRHCGTFGRVLNTFIRIKQSKKEKKNITHLSLHNQQTTGTPIQQLDTTA